MGGFRAIRVAATSVLVLVGCRAEPPSGELMLVLDGTVEAPRDIDTVHVEIRTGDTLVHTRDYEWATGETRRPGTLGIVPGSAGKRAVSVRVVGRKGGTAGIVRILREARTQVPAGRIAALPMLLSTSCLDRVKDEASSCGPNRTCVGGSCVSIDVSAADLPDFVNDSSYEQHDGVIDVAPRELITTKAGGKDAFDVRLGTRPRADVRIPIAISAPTQGVANRSELAFTPDDWATPQSVQVTGLDDGVAADGSFDVLLGTTESDDARYRGLDPLPVHVLHRAAPSGCTQPRPLRDDFESPALLPANWTTETSNPISEVSQSNGRITLRNRGYLISARQFDPSAGAVRITGRWTFGDNPTGFPEYFQVLTRSDAVPVRGDRVARVGLDCQLDATFDRLQILSHDQGQVQGTGTNASFHATNNETCLFEVIDDGTTITCTLQHEDGTRATAQATSTLRSATNFVVFYNREKVQNDAHVSYLEEVQIEQGLPRPTHQWTLDEASAQSAYDVVGTAVGTLGPATTRARGIHGGAIALSGSENAYVDFGTSVGPLGTSDFSVSFWFNANATNADRALFGNRAIGANDPFFEIRMDRSGRLLAELAEPAQSGSGALARAAVGLDDGAWHHGCVIRRGLEVNLYVDGLAVGRATPATLANLVNVQPTQLGTRASAAGLYAGAFDDVRIFDRALDGCEVFTLAARP